MGSFEGKSAIVTGAASGIGLALSRELVSRGARVWLTDLDEEGVRARASELGESATGVALDVTDPAAFTRVVEAVSSEAGGLDALFNNAGIGGWMGEYQESSIEVVDAVIDINIRGVTNGVMAAYPGMIERGSGQIVNTASAAGLLQVPLMAVYSMSKHAVVGLTKSLRLEGERHGVGFSVLCPSAIETPLLDSGEAIAQTGQWVPNLRRFLTALAGPPAPVADFASYALDAVARNEELVVFPASARMGARAARWVPGVAAGRVRKAMLRELADKP